MHERKNVLLITVDQWSAENIGHLGNNTILTPTLDELAASGISYTKSYSATPVCIPARRELMTGTGPATHGDICQTAKLPMPKGIPTLASVFRDAGYQTYAVGKLHIWPQRDRIGFDDVLLHEEGRHQDDMRQDDYERFLSLNGYHGLEYEHGMNNNNYMYRPFPLPEKLHPTHWTASQMCEVIRRKDPTRPAFWYMSFAAPHPPLSPIKDYLYLYDNKVIPMPYIGDWAMNDSTTPYACKYYQNLRTVKGYAVVADARKAAWAECTYIDHRIRTVLGTLRECGELENTIILFTADHGDMLGNHGLWCKNLFYESSCRTPLILVPTEDFQFTPGSKDDRLVLQRDIMATMCDMCGIEIPNSCEGHSIISDCKRDKIFGELWTDERMTRMLTDGHYKLIYYGYDNQFQLFDLDNDPKELKDVSKETNYRAVFEALKDQLADCMQARDTEYLSDGEITGLNEESQSIKKRKNFKMNKRSLLLQRGIR